MKQRTDKYGQNSVDDEIDIKEYLSYFLVHWKVFLVSLMVCIGMAFLYLYLTMPVYQVSARIMVRDEKRGGDFLTELSVFDGINAINNSNTDNELEVLKSKTLIKDVIYNTQIYKDYKGKKSLKKVDLFGQSPILLVDTMLDIKQLKHSYYINVQIESETEYSVCLYTKSCVLLDSVFTSFPIHLSTPNGELSLVCKDAESLMDYSSYEISLVPPINLARIYLKNMMVMTASKNSSIVDLKLNTTNEERGVLFLNTLIKNYNATAIEEKNEVAAKTADFINERVMMLAEELGTTEKNLEKYKKKEGLTDLASNAQLYVSQGAVYEQKRVENETQLNLVRSLKEYLNREEHRGNVIPANVGLTDAGLVGQIEQYNQLLLSRNRLMRSTSETNPVVLQQTSQIEGLYDNVKLLVDNVEAELKITQSDIKKQYDKYRGLIYNIPTQERLSVEIERERQIQQQLFLMLLQKREENALAMAATVNKAKIVEECLVEPYAIAPKKSFVLLVAIMIALVMACLWVLLKKYFSVKISCSAELEHEGITTLPILGDLPLLSSDVDKQEEDARRLEAFRLLRTNVQFMLKNSENKVVLFTSFLPNEGKTFVSAHTAISFASLSKKVIVIGADIRNPQLKNFFSGDNSEGLSLYLSSSNVSVDSLIKSTDYSNLDYIMAGPVPPNSTELLSSSRWDALIEELRKRYDYILIDSAPVAIVSDTLVLGRVADLTVFVFRANTSNKNWFKTINKFAETERLRNVSVVVNGVQMDKNSFEYGGYGYGGYGYGYSYGNYYGYGKTKSVKK